MLGAQVCCDGAMSDEGDGTWTISGGTCIGTFILTPSINTGQFTSSAVGGSGPCLNLDVTVTFGVMYETECAGAPGVDCDIYVEQTYD